jgi:hypothetical protein
MTVVQILKHTFGAGGMAHVEKHLAKLKTLRPNPILKKIG